jgi:hypothetical protein
LLTLVPETSASTNFAIWAVQDKRTCWLFLFTAGAKVKNILSIDNTKGKEKKFKAGNVAGCWLLVPVIDNCESCTKHPT